MKIAISAEGADFEAKVVPRFGNSRYLVILDLDSKDIEALPNPGPQANAVPACRLLFLPLQR